MPAKLAELQRLFLIQAARFNVLPLDNRLIERLQPRMAGRPELIKGESQLLFAGMRRLSEDNMVNVKNRSHTVTAEVVVPEGGATGVIMNQGGVTGGWVLWADGGRLAYAYNWVGLETYRVAADAPLPPGEHQVRMEFAYDGGGIGKGGEVRLYVDGEAVAGGRVERTHPMFFNLDETNDVGADRGARVIADYPAEDNGFSGRINWVRIDAGDDSHDHLIPADLHHLLAMTKQ
jgi:hypothetical protein